MVDGPLEICCWAGENNDNNNDNDNNNNNNNNKIFIYFRIKTNTLQSKMLIKYDTLIESLQKIMILNLLAMDQFQDPPIPKTLK